VILVVPPTRLRGFDVTALSDLGPSAKQDHESLPVLSEIDAVAWPEIHPELEHARTDAFDVREIALSDAHKSDRHPGGGLGVEAAVGQIIEAAPSEGVAALLRFSREFDGVDVAPATLQSPPKRSRRAATGAGHFGEQ
jgi:hypothetical protein